VVKSELVRALNEKLPELQLRDVELALNCMLEQMANAIVQDQRIEIRGLAALIYITGPHVWHVIQKQVNPLIYRPK
jgi:nucleoid DNA-binding protein